ncbi:MULTISPECIES: hypothetical protein [Actinomadura]|uniref:Uncharacterized protein n=1 Tax=Actinomadura madurae TaxID=1993 RepID=A0A1I5TQJ8_9ACTN|nr:hypothetical protein [Actinomadura madurae]SFP84626.1 hypothetical protein SAMN04489713_11863 [Actinomadura madurae]
MTRRLLYTLPVLAVVLSGCGEDVRERSFTDTHGRVCTYILVEEWDGDKDVGNISCEYPRSPGTTPSPAPSPSG